MGKKRERSEIVHDMLKAIQNKGGEIKPTHLMYKANLSHSIMKQYLDDLVENSLVERVKRKNYQYLIITDKGNAFLEKFRQFKEFERTFGL